MVSGMVDSLIVIGMATVSLGVIYEADGMREHTFTVRNTGQERVVLRQGYTSCGCTTIHFDQARLLAPSDTATVTLRFNPRGKGGDFEEVGTVVYSLGDSNLSTDSSTPQPVNPSVEKHLRLSLTGTCITSEETLLRQFPIRLSDSLRLSADRFDMGIMHRGEHKERHVVLLHRNEADRKETFTLHFTADLPPGLHHVPYPFTTRSQGRKVRFIVTLDVIVR